MSSIRGRERGGAAVSTDHNPGGSSRAGLSCGQLCLLGQKPGCALLVGSSLPPTCPDACMNSWASKVLSGILALLLAGLWSLTLPGRPPGQIRTNCFSFLNGLRRPFVFLRVKLYFKWFKGCIYDNSLNLHFTDLETEPQGTSVAWLTEMVRWEDRI